MMGEERRVGCIFEMFEMLWNVRRPCQSWHCCYANFARVGRWEGMMEPSEGWGAATKENPRIKICTKRRLSTPCPHPWVHQHTTPWAGLVIYQPYPGQPTPAQPHHHGSPNSDPASPPLIVTPGNGTWPFCPFPLILLICVQLAIQCLGRMLPAESPVSVTASRITPIFMFRSRGRSGSRRRVGAVLVSLISFLPGLINQYSHNICQARTKTG